MRLMLAALLMAAPLGFAQTPTASLVGRIVDPSHAVVVAAAVQVRNLETNELRVIASQIDGQFTIADLRPGRYEVTVEKAGFKQAIERSIELQVGQTARLDLTLEVGSPSQAVEVTAVAPSVNTDN